MRAIRMMIATVVASVMTVFAVLGLIHVIEVVSSGLRPSPIAVSDSRIDFGRVPLHGIATQTLVVRNDSDGPIHARFLVVGDVYAVDPDELFLEPGVEWSITVMASPDRPGRLYDLLRIQIVGSGATVVIPLAAEAGPDDVGGEPGWEMSCV